MLKGEISFKRRRPDLVGKSDRENASLAGSVFRMSSKHGNTSFDLHFNIKKRILLKVSMRVAPRVILYTRPGNYIFIIPRDFYFYKNLSGGR